MRLLAVTGTLAAVPVLALAILLGAGWLPLLPGLLAIGFTAGAALVLAVIWLRDATALNDVLRAVAVDGPATVVAPTLVLLQDAGREVERLARRVALRAAQLDRLQRADAGIVERLPDALIVLAADRSVRRANAAARSAFGADIRAVLRHPGLRAAIDRAFAEEGPQSAELTLPVPVPREVHATVVLLDPPLADGGQAVVLLSDRTRERVVERMRADFVANASHELRTPLASLVGFIETLRGPAANDPAAQQEFLGIMADQAGRMSRLIDDLLSLSRIELIEHQPPSDSVDLAALLPRFLAGYQPGLGEASARLDVRIAATLPAVAGDADQLQQVLQNLLDNAVKYGRPDGTVTLRAEPAPPGGPWPEQSGVVLAVTDQGPGIPREHLPRLTERFYRVDTRRSRAVGGTGLGLAIVKHVVNRHRGQLLIESDEGVGTTVSVWLPQTRTGGD